VVTQPQNERSPALWSCARLLRGPIRNAGPDLAPPCQREVNGT
jgi:hypothetical protein